MGDTSGSAPGSATDPGAQEPSSALGDVVTATADTVGAIPDGPTPSSSTFAKGADANSEVGHSSQGSLPHKSHAGDGSSNGGSGASLGQEMPIRGSRDAEPLSGAALPSLGGASSPAVRNEPVERASGEGVRRSVAPETAEWKAALAIAKKKLAESTPPPVPATTDSQPRRPAYGDSGDWRNALQAAKQKLDAAGSTDAPSTESSDLTAEAEPPLSSPPPQDIAADRPSSPPASGPVDAKSASGDDEWRAAIEMARRIHRSSAPPPPLAEAEPTPTAAKPVVEPPAPAAVTAETPSVEASSVPSLHETATARAVEAPATQVVEAQPAAEAPEPADQPVQAQPEAEVVRETLAEPPPVDRDVQAIATEAPSPVKPDRPAPTEVAETVERHTNEALPARSSLTTAQAAGEPSTPKPTEPSTEEDEWLAAIQAVKRQHDSQRPPGPPPQTAAPVSITSPEPAQAAADTAEETSEEDEWLAAIAAAKRLHEDKVEATPLPPPTAEATPLVQAASFAKPTSGGGLIPQPGSGEPAATGAVPAPPVETTMGAAAVDSSPTAEDDSTSGDEDEWLAAIAAAKGRHEESPVEAPPVPQPEPETAAILAATEPAGAAPHDKDKVQAAAASVAEAENHPEQPSAADLAEALPVVDEPTITTPPHQLRLLTDAELGARKARAEHAAVAETTGPAEASGSGQPGLTSDAQPAAAAPPVEAAGAVPRIEPATRPDQALPSKSGNVRQRAEPKLEGSPQAMSTAKPEPPAVPVPPVPTPPTAEQKAQWRAAFEAVRQRATGSTPSPVTSPSSAVPSSSEASTDPGTATASASASAAIPEPAAPSPAEAAAEAQSTDMNGPTPAAQSAVDVPAVAPAPEAQPPTADVADRAMQAAAPTAASAIEAAAPALVEIADATGQDPGAGLPEEPNQNDRPTPTVPPPALDETSAPLSSVRSAPHMQKAGGADSFDDALCADSPTLVGMPTPSLEPQSRPWTEPEATGWVTRVTPLRLGIAAILLLGVFGLGTMMGGSSKPAHNSPPSAQGHEQPVVPAKPAPQTAVTTPAQAASAPSSSDLAPAELERLKVLPQGERTAAQAAALGRHWLRQSQEEFTRFAEQLRKNPGSLEEEETRRKVIDYVNDRATSIVALELLTGLDSPRALDIVYEVWTGPKDRTDTTRLAEALLHAKDVRPRLSPALALALELREKPTSCETMRKLTLDAIANGDRRSAMLLVKTGARRDCSDGQAQIECAKCLEDPKQLRDAIRTAAGHEAPPL